MKKYAPLIVLAMFAIGVYFMVIGMKDITAQTTQGARIVQE